MQLTFDIFLQRLAYEPEPTPQPIEIIIGDTVSVMNKTTFEHAFHVVLSLNTGNRYMKTIFKGACQSTLDNKCLELNGLSPFLSGAGYENDFFSVVKTDNKNPKAEWVKAGLLTEFTRHHAIKSHAYIKNR